MRARLGDMLNYHKKIQGHCREKRGEQGAQSSWAPHLTSRGAGAALLWAFIRAGCARCEDALHTAERGPAQKLTVQKLLLVPNGTSS